MPFSTTHHHLSQLALDICRGPWLLYNAESQIQLVQNFFAHLPVQDSVADFTPLSYTESGDLVSAEPSSRKECVAVIPIVGTITKYDSCATIGATTVASVLVEAAENPDVVGVVLDIDSGGGSCSAIPLLEKAISSVKSAGKPIIVHADLCASAAYWIASMCDAIFADNSFSEFGSIGVMAQMYRPAENVITVYAEESPDKNREYREALSGNIKPAQQSLSPIVAEFRKAVSIGRPNLKKDTPGILSGAMFNAHEATDAGLINGMSSLEDCIQNVFIRASKF